MTLTEFLSTASADDSVALSEAQAHTAQPLKLVPCETVNSLLAQTKLRVALKKLAADENSPFQDAADTFIDSTFSGQPFNFTAGTAAGDAQLGLIDQMIDAGITVSIDGASVDITSRIQAFKDKVMPIANKTAYPFKDATIEQVKAIRHPATWQPVSMATNQIVTPEGNLVSNSDRSGFRFTLTPAESHTGKVQIRILAKKPQDTEFKLQENFPIIINGTFSDSQLVTYFFKRVVGLSGYRHFKFEYLPVYDGAISAASVEGIA